MATLLTLRTKLNGELGVDADGEGAPWSTAVRNSAISDGFAELWRVGVWKPLTQTITLADSTWRYALTSMRQVARAELQDSSSRILSSPAVHVESDGSTGYNVMLQGPIPAGNSLVLWGWGAYKSTFSGDSDTDDIPADMNRVPLLKAKQILFTQQIARWARYAERTNNAPEMNVTGDTLLRMAQAALQEFELEAKRVRGQMPHYMQSLRVVD